MLARTYAQFFRTVNGLGAITGANTLDIASVGIDLGLLNTNISVMTDWRVLWFGVNTWYLMLWP